jgi:hypothetical protein
MKKITKLSIAVLFASVCFISCKKSTNTNNPTTTSPVPTAPTPTFSGDIKGALISLRISFDYDPNKFASLPITVPVVELESESATAFFGNDLSSGNFLNAGNVAVNSYTLDKQSNNSYTKLAFDYTSGEYTLGFSSGSNWNVAGSSDVTAFTYNHTDAFPNFSGKSSMPETASTTTSLSINLSGKISNADSVYVFLGGNGKSIIKHLGSSASSATFTAAEVASIGSTSGKPTAILEVVPWRYRIQNINSKDYVFVKEQAVVKYVTIN